MTDFLTAVVAPLIEAATELLSNLGDVFVGAIELVYDGTGPTLTELGVIIVATAGFALAWSGIRFIFSFVNRLLGRSRGGAR